MDNNNQEKVSEAARWREHGPLLRAVSRSFFLSVRFLPRSMREPVTLGYLLARLSDTVADTGNVSIGERMAMLESLDSAIRGESAAPDLNSFARAATHAGEKELLHRADTLLRWLSRTPPPDRDLVRRVLDTILTGQRWDVRFFGDEGNAVSSAEETIRYAYLVAGSVGEFWTDLAFVHLGDRFAPPEQRASLLECGRLLGEGLQLINIIRDLREDLPRGRRYLPETPVDDEVLKSWIFRCRERLEAGRRYVAEVRHRRLRFATALPLFLAEKTADALVEAGAAAVTSRKIKIPRSEVRRSALRALLA